MILFVALFAVGVRAETDDLATQDAATKTENMLTDPAQRAKLIQKDPNAAKTDSQVQALAGNPENAQKIYQLAGKVLDDLIRETKGDPKKMMEIVEKAKTDPGSFAGKFSPEELRELQDLATKLQPPKTTP